MGMVQMPGTLFAVALVPEQVRDAEIIQFLERTAYLRQYFVLVMFLRQPFQFAVSRSQVRLELLEDALGLLDLASQRLFLFSIFCAHSVTFIPEVLVGRDPGWRLNHCQRYVFVTFAGTGRHDFPDDDERHGFVSQYRDFL